MVFYAPLAFGIIMSLLLARLNKINSPAIQKNTLKNITFILALLGLSYVLYTLIFQTFTIILATLTGSLASFYFIRLKSKAQEKAANTTSLLQLRYLITLYSKCNDKFAIHKNVLKTPIFPWENLINFYDFQTLPSINLESLSFLQEKEGNNNFFETILAFNSCLITFCKALSDLQFYNGIYLEKINIWESKIKTIKGVREMQSTDLKILKQKIGDNLTNQLIFLTDLIHETSSMLTNHSTQLIFMIDQYKK